MNGTLAVWTVAAGLLGQAPDAPRWHTDYGAALAATKLSHRPLLVVIDDPSVPERRIEQVSIRDDATSADLMAAYELCHIDATTRYGRQVAESFKARDLPYTAIIDRTGSVILHQQTGRISTQSWVATLATYRHGEYRTSERAETVRSGRICFG
jgi:hypothetical protein